MCRRACRLGDWSQHPTWAHVVHRRRWTHEPPSRRHSTQPGPLAALVEIASRWVQTMSLASPSRSAHEIHPDTDLRRSELSAAVAPDDGARPRVEGSSRHPRMQQVSTASTASADACGASCGKLWPMPPEMLRCSYGPVNLLT